MESEGLPVAVVRRFDRDGGLRIPYISAATLLGATTRDPEPHSYTKIVDALRTHGDNLTHELEEVDRAASNWRTRGREIGMSKTELDQFADAFERGEREAVRRIGSG